MFEGLQATMAERVTSILASDNMFMERIQENMEFTLLPHTEYGWNMCSAVKVWTEKKRRLLRQAV